MIEEVRTMQYQNQGESWMMQRPMQRQQGPFQVTYVAGIMPNART